MLPLNPIPRILIVDDNRAIHEDFRKILSLPVDDSTELDNVEAALFGGEPRLPLATRFQLDSAYQGADAIRMVEESLREGNPYVMAFMDVRMPPGLDGIETTSEIWKRYPDLQVVLCTAYSDYSWSDLIARLGRTDRLVILKKPFDNIEVLQLVHAMTEKWRLLQQARTKMADMETMVRTRTLELSTANEQLQIEVAERKQAQLALQESQNMILRQERLAAVGQLSAGVAHDFNNIMTVIHGHASLLLLGDKVTAAAHEPLHEIEIAAMRAAKLTQQLLAFSRKQVMQPHNLNLGEIAVRMAAMLERAIGEEVKLSVNSSAKLPAVYADATMVEQVLMNLAVNARDAMPGGGELNISVEAVSVNAEQIARHMDASVGTFVCLEVQDTGTGMDDATLSHIFEPFFTTKDVGKGTGLGLATAYGIVRQHQGWIEVQTKLGEGTTFKVFFPAVPGRVQQPDGVGTNSVARGNGETVLVVEDEPALRSLVRKIIQRFGYHVIEAKSGREALDIWQREKDNIDLLLTDIVMPEGISGRALATSLLTEKPDLKVIFTSGYDRTPSYEAPRLVEGKNFLRKPYSPAVLAEIVHRCLEEDSEVAELGAAA